jgi:hypothetical protein
LAHGALEKQMPSDDPRLVCGAFSSPDDILGDTQARKTCRLQASGKKCAALMVVNS